MVRGKCLLFFVFENLQIIWKESTRRAIPAPIKLEVKRLGNHTLGQISYNIKQLLSALRQLTNRSAPCLAGRDFQHECFEIRPHNTKSAED